MHNFIVLPQKGSDSFLFLCFGEIHLHLFICVSRWFNVLLLNCGQVLFPTCLHHLNSGQTPVGCLLRFSSHPSALPVQIDLVSWHYLTHLCLSITQKHRNLTAYMMCLKPISGSSGVPMICLQSAFQFWSLTFLSSGCVCVPPTRLCVFVYIIFICLIFSSLLVPDLLPVQDAVYFLFHRNTDSLFAFAFSILHATLRPICLCRPPQNLLPKEKPTVHFKLAKVVEIFFHTFLFTNVKEPSSPFPKRKWKCEAEKALNLQTSLRSLWEELGGFSQRAQFSFIKLHHVSSWLARWNYWHL